MHYSAAILSLFTASMAPTTLSSLSADVIKEAVGDGCRNHIDFKGRFRTKAGSICGSCSFCEGSTVNSLFIPQAKDTCVQCTKAEDTCSIFEVITSFENAWTMKYATLTSSAMAPASDPKKVTILASNDLITWEVLHSPELNFLDREQKAEFIINNEKKYKHYSVQFERSDDEMNIGKYGLVEAYTRGCTSKLLAGITGELVPVYSTSSPTNEPSNEPTSQPTAPLGYEFTTRAELNTATSNWRDNEASALLKYGDIKGWRTGKITNMDKLFRNFNVFNADLSSWDTGNVTTMQEMFMWARAFNNDLSDWNTAKVANMKSTFTYTDVFNQSLSTWNTSSCTTMMDMFRYASKFNGDLSSWDVAKVKDMLSMFSINHEFNSDLSKWDTSNVTRMSSMFHKAKKLNSDLSSWNTSSCTDMENMFRNYPYNVDLSSWDTAKVVNMKYMFTEASAFNSDLSKWDISNVTMMNYMFQKSTGFNQKLCWDVSDKKVLWMFYGSPGSIDSNYPNC